MKVCIYCGENEQSATFNGREHVMPRLMGTFENSPVIKDFICDNCNSVIFSKLEVKFKEDTEEGIYYQMHNFENKYRVRIRAEKVKTELSPGLGDKFFDEIFPFFIIKDGSFKITLLPQIKIKKPHNDGYEVLLVKEVNKLNKESREFKGLKESLKGVEGKNVRIFTQGQSENEAPDLEEAIELLKELGINYTERERKFSLADKSKPQTFEVSMDCTVGNDAGRVIAKIAFNYLAYCLIKSGKEEILFDDNFKKIKDYITGKKDYPIKEIITNVSPEPIIFEEKDKGRFLAHLLTFEEQNGEIVAQLSLMGRMVYTIKLGPVPKEIKKPNFGSGHLFDPIGHKIFPLSQNSSKWGKDEKLTFNIFNKT